MDQLSGDSMSIICKVIGHNRDRNKVWDDGMDLRSECARCKIPMIKDHHHGWRPFNPELDFSLKRK